MSGCLPSRWRISITCGNGRAIGNAVFPTPGRGPPRCQEPVVPLTIIHARAIGLMTMIDSCKKDHKIIAIATEDPEFNAYREAAEMPPHRLIMLRRFFQDYKQLEGKSVEVDEIQPATHAYPIIEDALHRYSEQRRKGFDGVKG